MAPISPLPSTRPIGITLGDPAGIGPEIVLKCIARGLPAPAVVYGDPGRLTEVARLLSIPVQVRRVAGPHAATGEPGIIEVIATGDNVAQLPWGQVNARAGQAAYDALVAAIDAARTGALRAIVTAPLNKAAMHLAGLNFPGHTEILAKFSNIPHVAMMLANDELRVLLVTIHMALADVPGAITLESELTAIKLAHQACYQMGIARPRIAVAGLNPHAGEAGQFGREDIDIIAPAIEQARAWGLDASGPWPGDTIFMRARRGEFDIVVAQYHDQGLIPVKYLGVDAGVNVTVGLPFVRTSVDHGTAFDIAGQGIANPASLHAAFVLACQMSANASVDAAHATSDSPPA
jgi:4-hydroxythreonine-4-phosphate dehydrogenase